MFQPYLLAIFGEFFLTYADNASTSMSEIPHEIKIVVVMIRYFSSHMEFLNIEVER